MSSKQCTNCLNIKILDDFNKDKKGKYDRMSICKICRKRKSKNTNFDYTYINYESLKKCNTCDQNLQLSEFTKNKLSFDGFKHICKKCKNNKDKQNQLKDNYYITEQIITKECFTCKQIKSTKEFRTRQSSKDKLNPNCKDCLKLTDKIYREENKEEIDKKRNLSENKEKRSNYDKIYYKNNQEKKLNYSKEYKKNNKCIHKKRKDCCIECSPNIACQLCNYTNIQSSNYKPYCAPCHYYLNPKLECSIQFKLKENLMVDEIKKEFSNLNFTFDKRIDSQCSSNKRPDIRIELYTCSIILECDEFQHKRESKECELERMQLIYEDLGNRPIIFIRFNPDNYINKEGEKIEGCFKKDKTLNKSEWKKRIQKLKERINYYLETKPEYDIEYLFYDELF